MSCNICYDSSSPLGVKCRTCEKRCCISCENNFQQNKCPFCRTELPKWFSRIRAETISNYYEEFKKNEMEKICRFSNAKILAEKLIVGDSSSQKIIKELSENGDSETILNILVVLRDHVYCIAKIDQSVHYINNILRLIEYLWSKLDNFDVFNVDMDYIEDSLFEDDDQIDADEFNRRYQRFLYTGYKKKSKIHLPKPFKMRMKKSFVR